MTNEEAIKILKSKLDGSVDTSWEWTEAVRMAIEALKAPTLPSADAERLADDDIETIRIHLSAIKGRLCNQRRWGEAEEYERLIDRFLAFAYAQPEIIRCKDCKYYHDSDGCFFSTEETIEDGFCNWAERREP